MQIVVVKQNKLYKYPFPSQNVENYWIKDIDEYNNERELILIRKKQGLWYLESNENIYIEENNQKLQEKAININEFIKLKLVKKSITTIILIYVCNQLDNTFQVYQFKDNGKYSIGKNSNQNIVLNDEYINDEHAILIKENNNYIIKTYNTDNLIFVNGIKVYQKQLEFGDVIFIYGYKIFIINNYLLINNPHNKLQIMTPYLIKTTLPKYTGTLLKTEENDDASVYQEQDYFSRSPRFVTSIIEENIKIDNPPSKIEPDETPVLFTVGPMLTMSMSSIVSASVSILNLKKGNGTLLNALPAIVISVTMLSSTLLWPTLMKKFNKKKLAKKENERQKKYIGYLYEKNNYIENLRTNQLQILNENYKEPRELQTIIINRKRTLWERMKESDDFLRVRIGVGTIPLKVNINYSLEDFSMIEDNLKEELKKTVEQSNEINNAPVTIDLVERNKIVIIGTDYYRTSMIKSILLQLATYHSCSDLKLVFMIEEGNELSNGAKILPHTWSNARDIRFFATNYDDMTKISFYLEQVYMERKYSDNNGEKKENNLTYKDVSPYYLIIVDNIRKNKNIEIINKVLKDNNNIGFGLIILNDGIANLPNECVDFLTAAGNESAIIKNDLNKNNQQIFRMDIIDDINFPLLCEKLSNIPIKVPLMLDEMKSSVGFLEMYKVGNIEQLNILERWSKNNPVNSLSVPIGIHPDGELFNLDLHEKFHGAHGLIAGMTGSGKSEFIITYILSMCLNFNPLEVSFVLIDYKGGGLTGAFENELTGIKLPHLAGKITNLDKAEINRSLSSIESELKRRQELFNKAKAQLNESTLDIYKYQKLYRDGLIQEPVSHLFIITDEFAELKSQQPEFMDELISTARIGRSLGVHLILATQKPSGIVDDQIWSNSKFKICLKVQEKSDSMEVIKRDDAAALKKAGRFYLQVGYNDYFGMGQAAYAGTKYIPREKITKTVDRNISFINNIGDITKSIETTKREVNEVSLGEELPNILKYICDNAKLKNMYANKLWLDKIPDKIYVNNLINKYSFVPKKWNITAIVGEYDDPSHQKQGLLTLDFNDAGNTLIYGADGKEIMLSSIVYSLIITHSPEELNLYILDFGTEMFGAFKDAPQIGDVVFLHESEKIVNLFNTIGKELSRRKKMFVNYNGNYNIFIKNSGKTLPRYIIIINNYEALNENYEDYVDVISSISREGEKYGISFIITATGVNAVRGRTTQNFNKQLCLQFNDPSDYSSILGSTHGMIPGNILGRGLVKLNDNILEFQTAYPYIWEEINKFIKEICITLNKNIKNKAKKIKILPENVRMNDVEQYISSIDKVPIGIRKDTLEIETFDFAKNPISIISAQDTSLMDKFISSLIQVIKIIPNTKIHVIDTLNGVKDKEQLENYYSDDYKQIVNIFEEILKEESQTTNIFLIYGIDNLMNNLDSNDKNKLKLILNNLKTKNNVKVILADAISKIKLFEYDDFYRNNVQAIYGIWIGSGITDQFTLKSSTYNKETRGQIPNNFGYNVDRGTAKLIKIIDFYTKE